MAITLLRQNDQRWYNHPFCYNGVIGTHGCGPTSMAMAVGDQSPVTMADWLAQNGYASSQYGTDHYGIIAGIKARGFNCWYSGESMNGIMVSRYFDTMIEHLASGKSAILLMGGPDSSGGACRTSYWCRSGHYVTACGFENNHIKIQDPADPGRDGYHVVYGGSADALNGNIKYIYLTNILWKNAPSTDYTFTCPQIQLNSKGAAVAFWQVMLRARGLYDGPIDGDFGDKTCKATIAFQRRCGIKQDCIVGPTTWSWMIPLESVTSGSSITFTAPQIQTGYQGYAAYFWQDLLRGLGYISYPSDFSFGKGCRTGTLALQADKGLVMDAVAGPKTYKAAIGF